MTIRGQTRELLLGPKFAPTLDPLQTLAPAQLELRNCVLSLAGVIEPRPGFQATYFAAGLHGHSPSAITCIVPDEAGFVTTAQGGIFRLDRSNAVGVLAPVAGQTLTGHQRPNWINYGGAIVLVDGGAVVGIDPDTVTAIALPDAPQAARFVGTLDTYLLLAGWNDTDFQWSRVNSRVPRPLPVERNHLGLREHILRPQDHHRPLFPVENTNSTNEPIRCMRTYSRNLYFFCDQSIEVWVDIGGQAVFARTQTIPRGVGNAGGSVVQANNTFYFFGDDRHFYRLDGTRAVRISERLTRELRALVAPETLYGFDFVGEHMVRWFAPTDGRVLAYDYLADLWFFDGEWDAGGWQVLPVNAYAERQGKRLIGDRRPTGVVSTWDERFTSDNERPRRFVRSFQFFLTENGTTARVNRIRFRAKRGFALPDGTAAEHLVRWRFDQGEWAPYESLDLGVRGDADPIVDLTQLGIGRELALELVETDPTQTFITNAWCTYEPLGR